MAVYHHALVLINSSQDGVPLLQHAARMAEENGMRITIAHISTDYRALNYVFRQPARRSGLAGGDPRPKPCSTSWPAPSPCRWIPSRW